MRACTSGGEKSPRPPGGSDTRATSPSREGPLLHYAIHAFRPPRSRGPRALQSRPSSACAGHPNSRIEILDREPFAPLPSPSRTFNFQPRTLFFPFLSFPVRLSSGRESKGRESTRGREEFSRFFPLPFSFLHRYFVQSGVIANFSLEGNEKWRSGSKGERRISMVRRVP